MYKIVKPYKWFIRVCKVIFCVQ